VLKVRQGVARRSPVRIGKSNGLETQILQGVEESDRLIEHPPESVVDGTKVAPLQAAE
jgi:HlyD family secretion protein